MNALSRSHCLATATLAGLALVACGASDRSATSAADPVEAGAMVEISADAGSAPGANSQACAKMDILFVIDNSGSMQEEQANLAANFSVLTKKLDAFTTQSGALLDYRVAVTTSGKSARYTMKPESPPGFPEFPPMPMNDKGDDGRFRKGCGMSRAWLERTDTGIANQFSCIANVGTSGPGLEMPLESLRLALTDRVADGENAGFVREDALLAVVILSDEDDCSRSDQDFTIKDDNCPLGAPSNLVEDYVATLDKVKGGRDRWTGAVIAGPTSCQSGFGAAKEATRLKHFVSKSGPNVVFSSICLGDLTSALENALNTFDAACKKFVVK